MREMEHIRRLTEYFRKNLKKGYTTDSLKWALINQGYSRTAVEKAIIQVQQELAKTAPILKERPIIRHEILDEHDKTVATYNKKPWWKKIFGID